MRKFFFLSSCLFMLGFVQAQKTIAGTWHGKLVLPSTSLRVVFHIKMENATYTATMDSPDQGAKGIPVSHVRLTGDSMFLEVAVAGAKLAGRLTTDTSFSGYWQQGGRLPLELRKLPSGETVAERKRPQTPQPPFPYVSRDVSYTNNDNSIHFGGTVTRPEGAGPFPALLLLSGSGPQNRDEELFGHKPFAVLADYLTRQGYLVLRTDDRGVGETTGDRTYATSKDFADDAKAALDYLKSLPEVDRRKVGLLGHSEGGMLAQMLAAQKNDLAFLVLLAAPGQHNINLMVEQNKAILKAAGLPDESIEHYLALYKPLVSSLVAATSDNVAKTTAMQVVNRWVGQTPKAIVAATTGINDEAGKQRFVNEFSKTIRTPWFQFFLQYNPDPYLRKVKAKVLALNGDKDIQVISATNLAALKASLQKSGAAHFDIIEMKGLNHLFQHCTRCTIDEYGELEETIAPEVLDTIGQWLKRNVK